MTPKSTCSANKQLLFFTFCSFQDPIEHLNQQCTDAQTVPEKAMLSQNLALQATKSCANANGLDFAGIAEDILEEFGELTHFYTAPLCKNLKKPE